MKPGRPLRRLSALASALAVGAGSIAVLSLSAAPAQAAAPLDCIGAIYVTNSPVNANGSTNDGQVLRVSLDGNAGSTSVYDPTPGTTGNPNQLGVGKGGTRAINMDRGTGANGTIVNYDPATGITTKAVTAGAGTTGAINPATGLYYYGSYTTTTANNVSTTAVTLYVYDPVANTTTGPVAKVVVPNPPANAANGDIAFDASGQLFLVDSSGNTNDAQGNQQPNTSIASLYKLTATLPTTGTTAQTYTATSISTATGLAAATNGIAFTSGGFLFLSSSANPGTGAPSQIRKINPIDGSDVANGTFDLPAGVSATDLGSCAGPSQVSVGVSFPDGRLKAGDQITSKLTGTEYDGTPPAPTGTTADADSGPQTMPAEMATGIVIPGETFGASVAGAGNTDLSTYALSHTCSNDLTNEVVSSGPGGSFDYVPETGTPGTLVTCRVIAAKPAPAITLDKTVSPTTFNRAGQTLIYSFAVKNTGNTALDNYRVTDTLSNLSALTCTPNQGATLQPNDTATCSATYTVTRADVATPGSTKTNNATVTGTPPTGQGNAVSDPGSATATNQATGPTASSDSANTTSGKAVTLPAETNDTAGSAALDPTLTVFTAAGATNSGKTLSTPEGTWQLANDGRATFTPATGYAATTPAVQYRITDLNGFTATANLTVTVRPGPSAGADTATTGQDTNITVNPLTNDTAGQNADGTAGTLDPTSVVFAANGTKTLTVANQGTYTINATTGAITFDPLPAFVTTATPVTYSVTDNNGAVASSTLTVTVTPAPPSATNDTASTPYNTAVLLAGSINDSAGGGGAIDQTKTVLSTVGAPSGAALSTDGKTLTTSQGTYVVQSNGQVRFTPVSGYSGTTTAVQYKITDAAGSTATATLTVTVRNGPTATPDSVTTRQNTDVSLNPLANDTPGATAGGGAGSFDTNSLAFATTAQPAGSTRSSDGKTLTVPNQGVYTIANGSITFDPAATFTGLATAVTYTVNDSSANPASSTVAVRVTAVAPTATNDAATTPFNTAVLLPAGGNDTPGPGATIDPSKTVLTSTGAPTGFTLSADGKTMTTPRGTFVVQPDGQVRFTPVAGYSGTTSQITYQVTDTNGQSATAKLQVTVQPGPTAVPDTATTPQNTNVSLDPTANDTGGKLADGSTSPLDKTSVLFANGTTSFTASGQGVYTINSTTGVVTFDPDPTFTGAATPVGYSVKDGLGNTATSTITVTVTQVSPTATDNAATTTYNTAVTFGVNADDTAGPNATIDRSKTVFTGFNAPTGSTLSSDAKTLTTPQGVWTLDNQGNASFMPAAGFTGPTRTAQYRITDTNGQSATANLKVTVQPGPTAAPDSATTKQNVNVSVNPVDNDTPGRHAEGTAGSFVPGTVLFAANGQPGTVSNAGRTLTVTNQGVYTIDATTGVVTFDPDPGFTLSASPVSYTATDDSGNTVTSTIEVAVTAVTPVVNNDAAKTAAGQSVTIQVLANDSAGDPSAPLVPGSVRLTGAGEPANAMLSSDGKTLTVPGQGTWQVATDGKVTFSPAPGFIGRTTPEVEYSVADANGTTGTATVSIVVGSESIAVPDSASTPQNTAVAELEVLANDVPGDLGNPCTDYPSNQTPTGCDTGSFDATSVVFPANGTKDLVTTQGTWSIDPTTGSVNFSPVAGFSGTATAGYSVVPVVGGVRQDRVAAVISIQVRPIAPTATDDTASTPFNKPVVLEGATNDTPGSDGSVSPAIDPAQTVFVAPDANTNGKTKTTSEGVWTVNANGTVTFTPATGYAGTTAAVEYRVYDVNGSSDVGQLTVTVQPGPAPAPDRATTKQDVNVQLSPLANDAPSRNADGSRGAFDASTFQFTTVGLTDATLSDNNRTVTVLSEGVYSADATGLVTFDPVATFTGPAMAVRYSVQDDKGNVSGSTIRITVTPVTPTAADDSASTPLNTQVTFSFAGNDAPGDASAPILPATATFEAADPPQGSTWTIRGDHKSISVPGEGTYTLADNGTVTFVPVTGYSSTSTPVTYTVRDDNGTAAKARLIVTVLGGPTASPDTNTTKQDVTVTTNVVANDRPGKDVNGTDAQLVPGSVSFATPQPGGAVVTDSGKKLTVPNGVYTINADGTIAFDPVPTYTGPLTPINYAVSNTLGNSAVSTLTITVTAVTPRAYPDVASTALNTPLTFDIASNDQPGEASSPIDRTSATFAAGDNPGAALSNGGKTVTVTGEGSYSLNNTGTVTFTPAPGYSGTTHAVIYTIRDDNATATTSTISVTVQPGPAANPDVDRTKQNVPVTTSVLKNDAAGVNADGTPGTRVASSVVLTQTGQPTGATVAADGSSVVVPGEGRYAVNADGTVTFDPEDQFTGTARPVSYRFTDSLGNTATSTLTVSVDPITPIAGDDSASVPANTAVTLPASRNDTPGDPSAPIDPAATVFPVAGQPQGAQLSNGAKTLTVPAEGVYVVNADGSVTFTPAAGFMDATTTPVRYQIADRNGTTATAALRVTVQAGPMAAPDSASTPQNVTVTFDPLANDSAGLKADGTAASFVTGSVVLAVRPGSPTGSAATNGGKTLTVPGEGVYTVNDDGTVTFDPASAFTGTATVISYSVTDSTGNVATSTIGLSVSPIRPAATDDAAATMYATSVTFSFVANDRAGASSAPIDPASGSFEPGDTTVGVLGNGGTTLTIPNQGSFALHADGTVTFTPTAGFTGQTIPVTYTVRDTNGTPAKADLLVTVQPGPKASADTPSTPQATTLTLSPLANDTPGRNVDGSAGSWNLSSVVLVVLPGSPTGSAVDNGGKTLTVPGQGDYTVNADGTVTFVPAVTFTGPAAPIGYTVADNLGQNASATIAVTVVPVRPVTTDDAASTSMNAPVLLAGATNDGPGAPGAPLIASSTVFPTAGQPAGATISTDRKTITVPGQGVWSVQTDGSVLFTPVRGYVGTTAAVTYQVQDTHGSTGTATLTATVQNGPSASPDTTTTRHDVDVSVSPLANDSAGLDPNGTASSFDPASLVLTVLAGSPAGSQVSADGKTLTVPGQGVYTVAANGTVTFDPAASFAGQAAPVGYTVTDAHGNAATSTVTITVTSAAPTASNDAATTPHAATIVIDVLRNDHAAGDGVALDPSSLRLIDPVTGKPVLSVTVPGQGVWSVVDNKISFAPEADFTGAATPESYVVSDVDGNQTTATVAVVVGPPGSTSAIVVTTAPGQPVTVSVLDQVQPAPGTKLKVGSVCLLPHSLTVDGHAVPGNTAGGCLKQFTRPGVGTWTVNPDGTVTFQPARGFTGAAGIDFQVRSDAGTSYQDTLSVKVAGKRQGGGQDGNGGDSGDGGDGSGGSDGDGGLLGLPNTGGPYGLLFPVAGLAILAGGLMLLLGRRRRRG